MRKIVVLGAAGKTALAFLQRLSASQLFFIESVIRDPEKIDRVRPYSDRISCFEYADYEALITSMKEASVLYLALPRNDDEVDNAKRILAVAKECNIGHIIYISALYNENQDSAFSSSKKIIESMIRSLGCSYTIIRPNFFMSRFTYLPRMISSDQLQLIATVSHNSSVTFIDVDDIAQFAVKSINDQAMHNIIAQLTGSRAYSMNECVNTLSEHLNKTIVYIREDHKCYTRRLLEAGYTPKRIEQQLETFDLWSQGDCEIYDSDYYDYMGFTTSTFSSYIERNKSYLSSWAEINSL